MKTFMDRLLPIFEPYIHINEKDGAIAHPNRYATNKEQSFIVFSAAGFPNIDNNFDALKSMFREWDSHCESINLIGEFFSACF